MGDLIERLRGMNEYWQHAPLYNEAADEIGRLKDSLNNDLFEKMADEIDLLEAEIERLQVVISAGIGEVQKVCDNRQHGPVEGLEDWAVHAADYLPEDDDDDE